MASEAYDVVVIGAGPAGENVAARCTAAGLSAAIVESELVGGECSYWACMPSKGLLRPGEVLQTVARTPGVRFALKGEIDLADALKRRDALAANWDDKYQVQWLDENRIKLYRGTGVITAPRQVTVIAKDGSKTELNARKAVAVATGTGAAIPPVPGLREANPWNNREITTAVKPPRRLIVLGGGVVGVEMAQAWKSLGSEEVTIVELAPRLLAREEPFVAEIIAKTLTERDRIKVLTDTAIQSVERNEGGEVTVTLNGAGRLVADEIVVAAGRKPLTSDIGLENIGLTPGKYIEVDDQMRAKGANRDWLYAVGDVNGRSLLTHTGKYQARVAGDVILGRTATAWGDVEATPRVIFTDPQVAACGMTEQQACDNELNFKCVDYGFGHTAGAASTGQGIEGQVRLIIDEDRRIIVGATFVGPGAGEMLHAATIAIVGKVSLETLWHAIPAFPTISEFWLRLLESYGL